MNILPVIRELFQHLEWADAKVWSAVLAASNAANDPILRDRLYHIHAVQYGFLITWLKLPFDPARAPKVKDFPDLAALARWGREYHVKVAEYLATVDEPALEQIMTPPWVPMLEAKTGKQFAPTTLRETLLQVAMHSTHHRGQVNARLRELGGEPPTTDFIAWLWHGKPQPEWGEHTA